MSRRRAGVRGLGDAYAFRRLVWLVIGTVVVPTLLLSVYGVYAVRNQRLALRQRLADGWEEALADVARGAYARVDALDVAVRDAARACGDPPCALAVAGVEGGVAWADGAASPLPDPLPRGEAITRWIPRVDGLAVGVLAVEELQVAWSPDPSALAAAVEAMAAERHPRSEIRLIPARPVAMSPAQLVEAWREGGHDAALRLEGPLEAWRLVLDSRELAPLLGLTSTLYVAGLVALLATVLTGVGLTLATTARELRLSRLQTDFVSSVSHELRTPLTSIRMFVETLQSGRLRDPERVAEALDLLAQETDRLSRRIERVLGWARMEAGRRVYEAAPVAVEAIIADALAAHGSQQVLAAAPLPVEVALGEGLPRLLVDRDAVVEALLNLLQNAARHAAGATRVRIGAVGPVRGQLGLVVEDDGAGIARRHRKRVFEKFYQVDPLLSSGRPGSGLGLAIVRAVAVGHGGRVTLDSELGAGARFTLWLPVVPG